MSSVNISYFEANPEVALALVTFVTGITLGFLLGRLTKQLLDSLEIEDSLESTEFEQGLRRLGLTTVELFSKLMSWFVYLVTIFVSVNIAGQYNYTLFWDSTIQWLPQVFVALLIFLIGVVIADKVALVVQDKLQQVKLPQVVLVPEIVKYSIIYVVGLLALGQVGIETQALMVLLAIYMFGLILVTVLGTRRLVSAGTSGAYLLFTEPYEIGDRIAVNDAEGVVQEIEVLYTYIDDEDGNTHIIPNHHMFDYTIIKHND